MCVILVALHQWGEDNLYDDREPMTVLVDKADGNPIGRLRLTAQDGRVISPLDLKIKKGFASPKKQGQPVMQRRRARFKV